MMDASGWATVFYRHRERRTVLSDLKCHAGDSALVSPTRSSVVSGLAEQCEHRHMLSNSHLTELAPAELGPSLMPGTQGLQTQLGW